MDGAADHVRIRRGMKMALSIDSPGAVHAGRARAVSCGSWADGRYALAVQLCAVDNPVVYDEAEGKGCASKRRVRQVAEGGTPR